MLLCVLKLPDMVTCPTNEGCEHIKTKLPFLQHLLSHFLSLLYFYLVKTTILNYQSPTTGLFPVKTFSTCKEAKVRDSLYCAAGAWALAMAYRLVYKDTCTINSDILDKNDKIHIDRYNTSPQKILK